MPCLCCNLCNECGRADELMARSGKRTCPGCHVIINDNEVRTCPQCGAALPPPFPPLPGEER